MSRHKDFKQMMRRGDFDFTDANYDDYEDDPHCEECGIQDGSGRRDHTGSYYCEACWRRWQQDKVAEKKNKRNVMSLPPHPQQITSQTSQQSDDSTTQPKRRRRGKRKPNVNAGNGGPPSEQLADVQPPRSSPTKSVVSPDPLPHLSSQEQPPQQKATSSNEETSSKGNLFSSFGQGTGRAALFSSRKPLFNQVSSPESSTTPQAELPSQADKPSPFAQTRPQDRRREPTNGSVKPFDFSTPSPDDVVRQERQRPIIKENKANSRQSERRPRRVESTAVEEKLPEPESKTDVPSTRSRSIPVGFHGMRLQNQKALKRVAKQKDIVLSRQRTQKGKPHINLVVVGHVDAGKSTLMGHFLYQHGRVDRRAMHKFEKESAQIGKGSFAYAWVLDCHEEERSRGITVDVSVNHFETEHRRVTLLDSPGHRDFIPNMISGAAQADHAILVLNAATGDFEAGFDSHGQTKEHSVLIRSLGVKQVILAVNKMDTVDWSQDRYGYICTKVTRFLVELGFRPKDIWPVPVSGISGVNLTERAVEGAALWYSGPTLLQLINELKSPKRGFDKPLRMAVSDIYRDVAKGGPVVSGKIITGSVIADEQIVIQPANLLVLVKNVYGVDGSRLEIGRAGDNVQLNISQVNDEGFAEIHMGDFISVPANPMPISKKFEVQVMTLHNLVIPLCRGQEVVLHVQSINTVVRISKLHAILNKRTYEVEKNKPRHISPNQCARLTLKTVTTPICLETYQDNKHLGRVTLRRDGQTIAVGLVMVVHT